MLGVVILACLVRLTGPVFHPSVPADNHYLMTTIKEDMSGPFTDESDREESNLLYRRHLPSFAYSACLLCAAVMEELQNGFTFHMPVST